MQDQLQQPHRPRRPEGGTEGMGLEVLGYSQATHLSGTPHLQVTNRAANEGATVGTELNPLCKLLYFIPTTVTL